MLLGLVLAAGAVVASADGVKIHYTDQGKGEPALVFVHCWSCDRHLWDAQVAAFSKTRRVVAIDLAGHGESGQDRKDWTIPAFGQDVKAVADALALKKMVLIGSSMGGPVSLEAARLMPGRVVGIVPVDTLQDAGGPRLPQEQLDAIIQQLQADFKGATERLMNEYLFAPGSPAAVKAQLIAAAQARPPAVAVAVMRGAAAYDPRPVLGEITVPVRAINSDMNATNVEGNRALMPGFDVVVIKGVGHYPMMEDPAGFNAALATILKGLR
jgi:pimeloyl-ACP methyl ester carboxylesterase